MWTYSQTSGRLYRDGILRAQGYAGAGAYKNRPEAQGLKNKGPLPAGLYYIGEPVNIGDPSLWKDAHRHMGPFALALKPSPGNEMFGRDLFYVHGDSTPPGQASEGCMIFARPIRNEIYESGDRILEVVTDFTEKEG